MLFFYFLLFLKKNVPVYAGAEGTSIWRRMKELTASGQRKKVPSISVQGGAGRLRRGGESGTSGGGGEERRRGEAFNVNEATWG